MHLVCFAVGNSLNISLKVRENISRIFKTVGRITDQAVASRMQEMLGSNPARKLTISTEFYLEFSQSLQQIAGTKI